MPPKTSVNKEEKLEKENQALRKELVLSQDRIELREKGYFRQQLLAVLERVSQDLKRLADSSTNLEEENPSPSS